LTLRAAEKDFLQKTPPHNLFIARGQIRGTEEREESSFEIVVGNIGGKWERLGYYSNQKSSLS
jgi:hypothetical protein